MYYRSTLTKLLDVIQPFITTPRMEAQVQYMSEPKLAPRMRLNSVESLTYRGQHTSNRSSSGAVYSETVFSAMTPTANEHDPNPGIWQIQSCTSYNND